jgi:ligand-binding SRPBCC domain-containing protein
MPKIYAKIVIDAPREKVWEVLGNFTCIAAYSPDVRSARVVSKHGAGEGAIRRLELNTQGYVEESVTMWSEGQGFSVSVIGPPNPLRQCSRRWWLARQGNGTEVTLEVNYQLKYGPIGALLDLISTRRALRGTSHGSLSGLKYHVETGEAVEDRVPELPLAA